MNEAKSSNWLGIMTSPNGLTLLRSRTPGIRLQTQDNDNIYCVPSVMMY